jgi:hypothetical protein
VVVVPAPNVLTAARPPSLARRYLASRRVPAALLLLAGCAAVLRTVLAAGWASGDGLAARQVPLLVEGAAAVVVAAAAGSPFGEVERTAAARLRRLRLGTPLGLLLAAAALLATGTAGTHLPGGLLVLPRDLAGLTGVALLSAAALGPALGWAGPVAYLVLAEYGLGMAWTAPWLWAGRAAGDAGGTVCAWLALAAGAAASLRPARPPDQ